MNVLFVGRLVKFKDPVTFIKAARLLSQSKIESAYQFVIAGDGELLEECKKLALGHQNITLLGWVKPEKVMDLMSQADIFCQLSPYENIWATTLISAMKYKKAIICTNVGCTGKYLKHKYHVFLITPNDHVALAEAISILASDDDLRRTLGENAYSFVQENLSIEKITDQIRQLLTESLVERKGGPEATSSDIAHKSNHSR
jgi:glycosyltransferase involved in cell wall biosynthesis